MTDARKKELEERVESMDIRMTARNYRDVKRDIADNLFITPQSKEQVAYLQQLLRAKLIKHNVIREGEEYWYEET